MTSKEKQYVSAMKKIDYQSLKAETISAYRLGKCKTVPIMTRLRINPQSRIIGKEHEWIKTDVLLIEIAPKSLVVISKTETRKHRLYTCIQRI